MSKPNVNKSLNVELAKKMLRKKKIANLFRALPKIVYFLYITRTIKKHKQTFVFRHRIYKYFSSSYNTFDNERVVEIPIVMEELTKYKGQEVLEVGNVLKQYFDFPHDVVDKYEIDEGVINEDVVSFKTDKKYDLIISISTLEHVGWDEVPKQDTKILDAIQNLKGLCKPPNGFIMVTVPVGYNPALDSMLRKQVLPINKQYFLKRISKLNDWEESFLG